MHRTLTLLAGLLVLPHAASVAAQTTETSPCDTAVAASSTAEIRWATDAGPAASAAVQPAPLLVTADDKPFTRLLPHLLSDLRRYPSRSSAIALGVGATLTAAALPIDQDVTRHATARGTDQVFQVGGLVGGGYAQAGGAIATYIVGRIAHTPRISHAGADLIRGQALNGLVTHALKITIRRDRPGGSSGHVPATYSFPSAHASASWTTATVLWRHFGWRAGVPGALLATYASGSRIQQKQHFLSDVIFGAALGVTAGRIVTIGHTHRQIVLAPSVIAGGAGIAVSLDNR